MYIPQEIYQNLGTGPGLQSFKKAHSVRVSPLGVHSKTKNKSLKNCELTKSCSKRNVKSP